MMLRAYCIKEAQNAVNILKTETNPTQYKILVEATFMLLLLHNRKRVGDIQYIELIDVTNMDKTPQEDDILEVLTPTERILTKLYRKIHTIGKGSKDLLVLIPRDIQEFVDTLLAERVKYIDSSNKYFFPNCNGTDEWLNGCYVQRKYSTQCGAKSPALIRSSKLRKHIATMMQLMDLRENEIGQVAAFMGHTQKTHCEFYRLPKDVLMIAKVSKILLKLEKGELQNCKNKTMDEIDVQVEEPEFSNSSSEDEELNTTNNFQIAVNSNEPSHDSESADESSEESDICTNSKRPRQSTVSDEEEMASGGQTSENIETSENIAVSERNIRRIKKRQKQPIESDEDIVENSSVKKTSCVLLERKR
ncbi:hypothetical protein NQ315_011648 [Exocentrus adspersus]|uniref:Tyr recombinase domain-containing protein n=1 Tax=Exocentrus adspersus TaxID=1586481 RepID=A0AAV8VB16_9CUCU|nr:hypothetical protein NQ315_011648 [Exocentrus adspersus]